MTLNFLLKYIKYPFLKNFAPPVQNSFRQSWYATQIKKRINACVKMYMEEN